MSCIDMHTDTDTDTDTDADTEIDEDVQGQTQMWGKSLLCILSDDVLFKTIETRIPKDAHTYKCIHAHTKTCTTYIFTHI